ncbi:MAG: glycosyltransferase [Prolixibacteraceae bacterium]|nr:glycosyltransferase [Prolixibacteraceae bacterium]
MNLLPQQLQGKKKKIVMAVTNDLVTDNRVHKMATTLTNMHLDVTLAGSFYPESKALAQRNYSTHRFNLWFYKGPLFYANYNFSLFFYLLFKRFDLIVANDLDTLPACFLVAKMTGKPLVYDSHEYFTEVPELVHRPQVKRIWEEIEKLILPKVKYGITVCQSIANVYREKYSTPFRVVRNLPFRNTLIEKTSNPPFPVDMPVILYQGAVNYGRGLQEAIMAMHKVKGARLVIIGSGDELEIIRKQVHHEGLEHKVILTGRIPFDELKQITPLATIGLSVEKDIGLNYRYALPNKLFDYIQAGVPVLAGNLPEIKAIVEKYKVGRIVPLSTPEYLADALNEMLSNELQRTEWQNNCKPAAEILCWENEEKIVQDLYYQVLNLYTD